MNKDQTKPISGKTGARYDGVQALRFFAALLVLITHSTFYTSNRLSNDIGVWNNGALGVDIFFVISGFVMMMAIPKYIGIDRGWRIFALTRLERIVPLYWIATSIKLLTVIAAPAIVVSGQTNLMYLIKSYLFLPAFRADGRAEPLLGVGWTLVLEVFFYSLIVLSLAINKSPFKISTLILCICTVISFFNFDGSKELSVYFTPRMIEFVLGMLIAKHAPINHSNLKIALSLIIIGITILLLQPFSGEGAQHIVLRSIPSAIVVLGVVWLEPYLGRMSPMLVKLGAASYALYLFHPLIAPAIPAILAKLDIRIPALSIALCVIIAIIATYGIYLWVERPIAKYLARGRATSVVIDIQLEGKGPSSTQSRST